MNAKRLLILKRYAKYIIAVAVFAIVMIFFGDQSLLNYAKRAREIRHLEEQRDTYRAGAKEARRNLETLQNTDSLERFAREHYYMHAPNEDVYIIAE